MGKMKEMDLIYQSAGVTAEYRCEDVLRDFGPNPEMFGELMVGTPECEMCWYEDGTFVPAHYAWTVNELTGRDAVLFTCEECE